MTQQQIAIAFLKEKALSAFQFGDIGTVRHLSGIALEKLFEEGKDGLELNDLLWAFTFMTFYSKSDWESMVIIDRAYNAFGVDKKPPTPDISLYVPLLNFVFDIIKLDQTHLEDHYNEISLIRISELPNSDSADIELLLTKVIEILWYIDNESDKWKSLSSQWKAEISASSRKYKILNQLSCRLQIQKNLLYELNPAETLQLINRTFSKEDNPIDRMMALAWFYDFLEDWDGLDRLLLKLKKSIPFESEYALSFQGLINSTRYHRKENKGLQVQTKHRGIIESNEYRQSSQSEDDVNQPESTPNDDSTEVAGILRYQRIQLTRPTALFHFQWQARFDAAVLELKRNPHGKANKRANMLSIVMLLEIEALRFWDLGMYHSAIGRKCQLFLDLGMYKDQFDEYNGIDSALKDALILAARSSDSKMNENDELTAAEHLLEILPSSKSFISEVVKAISKTCPRQYSSALMLMDIIEDAVQIEQLSDLARWSVKMFPSSQNKISHFNMKSFNFWAPIFNYQVVLPTVWNELTPVLNELFINPRYWTTNEELLTRALCTAPIDKSKEWADSMAKMKVTDDFTERHRYQVLFNSAIQIEELKEIVETYLISHIEAKKDSPEKIFWEYERKLLCCSDELPRGTAEIQQYLLEKIENRCQSIQSAKKGTYSSYGSINWDFARVDWSTCQLNQMYDAIHLIEKTVFQAPCITADNVSDFLLVIANMVRTAPLEFVKSAAKLARKITEEPPKVFDDFFNGGPLSAFTITKNVKDEINYAVIRMVTRLYRNIDESERAYFQKWSIIQSTTTDLLNLGFLSSLFFYMYLLGDDSVKAQSCNGLHIIYARVKQKKELGYVLHSVSSVLNDERKKRGLERQPLPFADGTNSELLKVFELYITHSYIYPDPDVREGCAFLVKAIEESGGILEVRVKAVLEQDVRARVRKVFIN